MFSFPTGRETRATPRPCRLGKRSRNYSEALASLVTSIASIARIITVATTAGKIDQRYGLIDGTAPRRRRIAVTSASRSSGFWKNSAAK